VTLLSDAVSDWSSGMGVARMFDVWRFMAELPPDE
jgi:hypothetical protein